MAFGDRWTTPLAAKTFSIFLFAVFSKPSVMADKGDGRQEETRLPMGNLYEYPKSTE